jgi:hypothetical protein
VGGVGGGPPPAWSPPRREHESGAVAAERLAHAPAGGADEAGALEIEPGSPARSRGPARGEAGERGWVRVARAAERNARHQLRRVERGEERERERERQDQRLASSRIERSTIPERSPFGA